MISFKNINKLNALEGLDYLVSKGYEIEIYQHDRIYNENGILIKEAENINIICNNIEKIKVEFEVWLNEKR